MNIDDYKNSNGQIENSKELIEDIVGAINGTSESGSSPNGNWMKFSNGLLICYSPQMTLSKASNYYLQGSWTFPMSFINTNYFAIGVIAQDTPLPVGRLVTPFQNVGSCTFYYQNINAPFTATSYAIIYRAIAIGRWK